MTDWTAKTVAAHFGFKSHKTVYAWENGDGLPDALVLKGLCRIYKVSAEWLLFGDEAVPGRLTNELLAALWKLPPGELRHAENVLRAHLAMPQLENLAKTA